MAYKQPKDEIGAGFPLTGNRFFAIFTGNGSSYNAAITGVTAYSDGLQIHALFSVANIADITLDVNGLGGVPVRKGDATDLVSGDIVAGEMLALIYYGGIFQVISKFYNGGFNLPMSGTVNGPLIWDGSAWVAGTVNAVPNGGSVGDTLVWDGTKWVSQKLSDVITEWNIVRWAYYTLGNENYFLIPINYRRPRTFLNFSLNDLQAYGNPTPSETVFDLPMGAHGDEILIFGAGVNPNGRRVTVKCPGSIMRRWNQPGNVTSIPFPTTVVDLVFHAIAVAINPFPVTWHVTYFHK